MATTEPAEASNGADRDHLIRLGLLPNPDGETMLAEGLARPPQSPLVDYFEELIHRMAERIESNELFARRQAADCDGLNAEVRQLSRALNWLRENYEFDELALEVIAHVANPSGKVGYLW